MAPHRHRQQDAKETGAAKPEENLPGAQLDWWIEGSAGVQHVESRQQYRHERRLSGTGAHGLDDVVLARVCAGGAQNQYQRNKSQEGRDYRKVWTKSEFENAVWIGAANYQSNDKAHYDRSRC